MFIAKNDEEQRSKIWRIVVSVSTALIILIGIFLLTKMFTTNPVEGSWKNEDGRMDLNIKHSGAVEVTLLDFSEQDEVKVLAEYTIDKKSKRITFSCDEAALKRMADKSKGAYSESDLKTAMDSVISTYTYSVDQEYMTLTECEYGDQMVFEKQ